MKLLYPLKHWLATLLMGPLFMIGYDLVSSSELMVDVLEILLLFCGYGLLFSLPVFLLYLWTFNLMKKRKTSSLVIKTTLDIGGVIAIAVTFLLIIKGSMAMMLTICYSIALVICSLFFRMDDKELNLKGTND